MSQVGWLSKEQENSLAKLIDEGIKANGVLELVDGYVAKIALSMLDDKVLEKVDVSPEFKLVFSDFVDALVDEDWYTAEEAAATVLNTLIDIPAIDEESEQLLFEGAVKLIIGAAQKALEKK